MTCCGSLNSSCKDKLEFEGMQLVSELEDSAKLDEAKGKQLNEKGVSYGSKIDAALAGAKIALKSLDAFTKSH